MTRREFVKAVKLARSEGFQPSGFFNPVFEGCALDTKRRTCTLHEVATLIVEHCATFNGGWLHEEQDRVEVWSKRFDLVG